MAMKTLHFKENEGAIHNPIGQPSSVPCWSVFGSQPLPVEHQPADAGDHHLLATKQPRLGSDQGLDKGSLGQFSIFPGDSKTLVVAPKPAQTAASLQTVLPGHCAPVELGFGQPMICAKYPQVDQYYGLFSAYGAQISGRVMLPMDLTIDEGPIFVNPKQYRGIIRRRKSRAKALFENKVTRKQMKYMHYSRHLHAKRRPRGSGGRFLTKTELEKEKAGTEMKGCEIHLSHPAGSQSSEVLQFDSGSLKSPKEATGRGSILSGSEVISSYTREDLHHFRSNHLGIPIHAFSGIMDDGHGIVMPTKLVAVAAASDNCCNHNA